MVSLEGTEAWCRCLTLRTGQAPRPSRQRRAVRSSSEVSPTPWSQWSTGYTPRTCRDRHARDERVVSNGGLAIVIRVRRCNPVDQGRHQPAAHQCDADAGGGSNGAGRPFQRRLRTNAGGSLSTSPQSKKGYRGNSEKCPTGRVIPVAKCARPSV